MRQQGMSRGTEGDVGLATITQYLQLATAAGLDWASAEPLDEEARAVSAVVILGYAGETDRARQQCDSPGIAAQGPDAATALGGITGQFLGHAQTYHERYTNIDYFRYLIVEALKERLRGEALFE
jgi:hypothetical protein